MATHRIFYATNRRHVGDDQWNPTDYGPEFSKDGRENLRFGQADVTVDDKDVNKCLKESMPGLGTGNGDRLSEILTNAKHTLRAFTEVAPADNAQAKLGSLAAFADLRQAMLDGADVLVFIHGFNVSWREAVGSAVALQIMLNRNNPPRPVQVVLFSWPSDGKMLPWASYRSDRTDAVASGYAVGRGMLKLRDQLITWGLEKAVPCGGAMHLLTHSMGNLVLANALKRLTEFTPGHVLPRLFTHVFSCAADVDDDALEENEPLGRLDELCEAIHVYFNRGDVALKISDVTKGNPDRLGSAGPGKPARIHRKVRILDASPLVGGITEHSYVWNGNIAADIRMTIDGQPDDGSKRRRRPAGERSWVLT